MSIFLEWHGPFRLAQFPRGSDLRTKFGVPGVYLWMEELPNLARSRLSYVGKASGKPTMYARQLEHYARTVAGLYMIPHEFCENGTKWAVDWENPESVCVLLDEERFIKMVRNGFRLAAATNVYLAPYRGSDLAIIERNLLYTLQPTGTDKGTRSPPKIRADIRHSGVTSWICPDTRNQFKEQPLLL